MCRLLAIFLKSSVQFTIEFLRIKWKSFNFKDCGKMENIELNLKNVENRSLMKSKSSNSRQLGLYHYYHTDFYYSMPEISSKYFRFLTSFSKNNTKVLHQSNMYYKDGHKKSSVFYMKGPTQIIQIFNSYDNN